MDDRTRAVEEYWQRLPDDHRVDAAIRGRFRRMDRWDMEDAINDEHHEIHEHAADYLAENDLRLQALLNQQTIAEGMLIPQSRVDNLQRRVTELEGERNRLETRLASLQARYQQHKEDVKRLQKEVDDMDEVRKKIDDSKKKDQDPSDDPPAKTFKLC